MLVTRARPIPGAAALGCALLLALAPTSGAQEDPGVHALTGARIVLAPGRVIESGTIVVRDGRIEAVGAAVVPPADARLWPGEGLTVYPGLIDAYVEPPKPPQRPRGGSGGGGEPAPQRPEAAAAGAAHPLAAVKADRRMVEAAPPDAERVRALREAGLAVVQLVPGDGVLRGSAAVVGLGDGPLGEGAIAADTAQVIRFERSRDTYPDSPMGAIAVVRQALLDARWYADARRAWSEGREAERPALNLAFEALQPLVAGRMPALFVAGNMLDVLRASAVAREASLHAYAIDAGDGYKRAAELAATKLALVVPLHFPDAPTLTPEGAESGVETAALRHWQNAPGNAAALHRAGIEIALSGSGLERPAELRGALARAVAAGLDEETALAGLTTVPARLLGLEDRLGTLAPGRPANLTVVKGSLFEPKDPIESVWVDGRRYAPAPKSGQEAQSAAPAGEEQPGSAPEPVAAPQVAGDPEAWRAPRPPQPAALLVKNATLWTSGPEGTIEGADLLVRAGTIAAVGRGLEAPPGAEVIDATGKHVSPGIIDAHSHAALEGVNECTHSVTAEVRMGDVIDSEDVSIYRLLAGGTTAQHLLHGSCNAIGGQNALIKNRWGEPPEGLKLQGGRPTIKFALGENPKRAGGDDRYPRSRGGVEEVIREAFTRARDYQAERDERARRGAPPPRRDLQLDAIAEILAGQRDIHSHSYRQSEILMLMRVAEDFGIRVRCFQHILEGYKVADEMAAHGACASGFSDWWAYKFEVYDAIPYNGFLMWSRGVLVSFNSDSSELSRRLNTEAAKAVKYGGVPPEEALRFVTLNPAKQLGLEDRMGSLAVGKDADFVIWSGSPLSTLSVAEQTWVDGRRYFDREADLAGRAALEQERQALLERAKAKGKPKGEAGDSSDPSAPSGGLR